MLETVSDPRKRHAFLIGWPLGSTGGVSEVVKNLAQEFASAGEFAPLVIEACENPQQTPPAMEFSIHRISLASPYDKEQPLQTLVAFCLKLPLLLWRWRNLCREFRIEVLNPHSVELVYAVPVLAKRLGLFAAR